jgi:hypothetical protein
MVLRADGEQIGVQIDIDEHSRVSQSNLKFLAYKPFQDPPTGLEGLDLHPFSTIAVGIMPEGAPRDKKNEWVVVVVVSEKHPNQQIHLVATQHCFGNQVDDSEANNLPRVVKFAELQQQGELLGRFEGCTETDLLWFTDYAQDSSNRYAFPATGCSFPSAEAHGPHGEKGGYNNKGKAIKITEVNSGA